MMQDSPLIMRSSWKSISRFAATLSLAFASTALAQGPVSDDEALARDSAIYARL
jgi:hypothetical protein